MPVTGTSTGASTEAERHEAHIRALLKELDRMEKAGKEDRVRAIRAELGDVVADAKPPAKRSESRPAYSRRTSR